MPEALISRRSNRWPIRISAISVGLDADTGRLILVSCLDNLIKGAAGQAIQNFNVVLGFDEREGLL